MRVALIVVVLAAGAGAAFAETELRVHVFAPQMESVGLSVYRPVESQPFVIMTPQAKPLARAPGMTGSSMLADESKPEPGWALLERFERYPVPTEGWSNGPGLYTVVARLGAQGKPEVATVAVRQTHLTRFSRELRWTDSDRQGAKVTPSTRHGRVSR